MIYIRQHPYSRRIISHNQIVNCRAILQQIFLRADKAIFSIREPDPSMFVSRGPLIQMCQTNFTLSFPCTHSLSLAPSLVFLSVSFPLAGSQLTQLAGIRPQPQCCDGRWQLAQKGWHVIGKCAAPKMSFLIKRF